MNVTYAFFAANRYWPNRGQLMEAYESLVARMNCGDCTCLITDEIASPLLGGDCVIIIPMSGAVQTRILDAASRYRTAILYGAYIEGNASDEVCQLMMRANAAPTLMDTWSVLHRTSSQTLLALNEVDLEKKLRLMEAYCHIHGATVLKIGETEPWVVSTAKDSAVYEARFGVKIISVAQEQLEQRFLDTAREQASYYYDWFTSRACGCTEPTDDDLWNAARMAHALISLMEDHGAKAAALACFNLLRTGTTACLGVSYVNNSTDMCVSCEGDLDSAITMLVMKKLSSFPLWMANPGLHPGGIINFNHCTSPIGCSGCPATYMLRSHHESGIGVSLQVDMPLDRTVTACRISNEASQMTVHLGHTVPGPYETACRTQMYVQFDDFAHYIDTALGCHQVFAFENISDQLISIGKMCDLQIL